MQLLHMVLPRSVLNKNNLLLNISYKIPMIVKPKPYSKDLNTGKDILGGPWSVLTTVHPTLNDHEYYMRPACVVHAV